MELDGKPVTTAELMPLALGNYGHFTSMRVEADGSVRGFALHLARLHDDCQATFGVGIDPDLVRSYVRKAVADIAAPLSLRVTVYDPTLGLGTIGNPAHPRILVTKTQAGEMPSTPLRVKTYPFTRDAAEVKHTGLWSQMHRRRDARLAGFDDALFVEPDGSVAEGATWTAGFIGQGGEVVWPKAPTLPGTTMQLLQQVHPGRCEVVMLDDLDVMAAGFATNVSVGVRPISAIDGRAFETDHPVLAELRENYAAVPGEVV